MPMTNHRDVQRMTRVAAGAAGEPRRAGSLLISDMVGTPSLKKPDWQTLRQLDGDAGRLLSQMGVSVPQHIGPIWICSLRKAQKGLRKTGAFGLVSVRGAFLFPSRNRVARPCLESRRRSAMPGDDRST